MRKRRRPRAPRIKGATQTTPHVEALEDYRRARLLGAAETRRTGAAPGHPWPPAALGHPWPPRHLSIHGRRGIRSSVASRTRRRCVSGRFLDMQPHRRIGIIQGGANRRSGFVAYCGFLAEWDATPSGYPWRGCLVFLRSQDGERRKTSVPPPHDGMGRGISAQRRCAVRQPKSGRRARRARGRGARRRHPTPAYARVRVPGFVRRGGGTHAEKLRQFSAKRVTS